MSFVPAPPLSGWRARFCRLALPVKELADHHAFQLVEGLVLAQGLAVHLAAQRESEHRGLDALEKSAGVANG